MKLFFIRERSSGLYIPRGKGIRGKGGTLEMPANALRARPFPSRRSANSFLGQWLIVNKTHRFSDFELIEREIDLA